MYCTLPLEKVVDGIVVGDVIQASLRFLAVQKLSEDGLSVLAFKATVLVRLSVHGIISEASPQASQTDSPQNEAKSYCGISGLGYVFEPDWNCRIFSPADALIVIGLDPLGPLSEN